jgi:hypothetical protein
VRSKPFDNYDIIARHDRGPRNVCCKAVGADGTPTAVIIISYNLGGCVGVEDPDPRVKLMICARVEGNALRRWVRHNKSEKSLC